MKKSALIIGEFQKTDHDFTGKLETLAIKSATITLQRNEDKEKDKHPDYTVPTAPARSASPVITKTTVATTCRLALGNRASLPTSTA